MMAIVQAAAVACSRSVASFVPTPTRFPSARELCALALERSLRLHDVEGRNAILVGYGALSEHDFDAGASALCHVLAHAYPP